MCIRQRNEEDLEKNEKLKFKTFASFQGVGASTFLAEDSKYFLWLIGDSFEVDYILGIEVW